MHTNIVWTGGDASRRRPTHQPQKETIMKRLIVAVRSDLPILPFRPGRPLAGNFHHPLDV